MFIVQKQTKKVNISPVRPATANELLKYEENLNGDYSNTLVDIKDTLAEYLKRLEAIENGLIATNQPAAKIAYITLPAASWEYDTNTGHYSQVVEIEGITANSQVDLMLNAEQLSIFWNKNLGFMTENKDGVLTVYAIGQQLLNDYTFQVSVTEVVR